MFYKCMCLIRRTELGDEKLMVSFRITEREVTFELKSTHILWNSIIMNFSCTAFQNVIHAKISYHGVSSPPLLVLDGHDRCLSIADSNFHTARSSYEEEFWSHPTSAAREIFGGCGHIVGSAYVKYDVESIRPVWDMLVVEQPISCKAVKVTINWIFTWCNLKYYTTTGKLSASWRPQSHFKSRPWDG
jgi:hypothetical protein